MHSSDLPTCYIRNLENSVCMAGSPMNDEGFPRIAEGTWPDGIEHQTLAGRRDVVVLLHGLFATTRSMQKASQRLAAQGFDVVNWGYPTFLRSIEAHCEQLSSTLARLQNDSSVRSVNFLTHSMGGILARYVIQQGSADKIRRMVMLAPPNAGSHLTRVSLGPFRKLLPAISELTESPDGLPSTLRELRGVEVGVIAAARDLIVKVQNTILPEQRDHRIVEGSHFALPKMEQVLDLSLRFLCSGTFSDSFQRQPIAA
ncbi:MAG: alpha/beta fold hydrolase [Aureliella sp.]